MSIAAHPLRPFVPADTPELIELYAQSIDVLTADDYSEDQRLAWASVAADAQAFAARLGAMTTLVVKVDEDYLGFASLKDNAALDMLYVHPFFVREGVATTLVEALERLARGRGSAVLTVEASDTAVPFFESRGWVATSRNAVPLDDQWLTNTTMAKELQAAGTKEARR